MCKKNKFGRKQVESGFIKQDYLDTVTVPVHAYTCDSCRC